MSTSQKRKNSLKTNHRSRIIRYLFIDSRGFEINSYSLNIHQTALYKDGNKIGLRKKKEFLKYYDEKIKGRLDNIKNDDFITSDELNKML